MKEAYVLQFIDVLFPFSKIKKNEEIIIYGAGNVGRAYITQVIASGFCKVKKVYDKNLAGGQLFGIRIEHPSDFVDSNLKVVISVEDENEVKKICHFIRNRGVDKNNIVWEIDRIEKFITHTKSEISKRAYYSKTEAAEYFGENYLRSMRSIKQLLQIKETEYNLVRIGGKNDGGYLMTDNFFANGIAYSFGIADDISWDNDMADRGYECYMYDHTIDELPFNRNSFHFFKQGMADAVNQTDRNLNTLEHYLKVNNHTEMHNMILKIDIEGAEYGFMDMVDSESLKKFDQLVFELHNITSPSNMNRVISFLEKIKITHSVTHVHANNWGSVMYIDDEPFPDVIEVSFVNNQNYLLKGSKDVVLPRFDDSPNCQYLPDIYLGKWNKDATNLR